MTCGTSTRRERLNRVGQVIEVERSKKKVVSPQVTYSDSREGTYVESDRDVFSQPPPALPRPPRLESQLPVASHCRSGFHSWNSGWWAGVGVFSGGAVRGVHVRRSLINKLECNRDTKSCLFGTV